MPFGQSCVVLCGPGQELCVPRNAFLAPALSPQSLKNFKLHPYPPVEAMGGPLQEVLIFPPLSFEA